MVSGRVLSAFVGSARLVLPVCCNCSWACGKGAGLLLDEYACHCDSPVQPVSQLRTFKSVSHECLAITFGVPEAGLVRDSVGTGLVARLFGV
jgi:hypothetical protein